MASLDMKGSYDLTNTEIDQIITKKSAGNYALGYTDDKKIFRVQYVGRSDHDLNDRLKKHTQGKYREFKYSYAGSVREAFEKECKNYHDFGEKEKLDNEVHPARPEGKNYPCPVEGCDEFD